MRMWTREYLKSEKGNALLMALSVIMVLTAFGTASLMTSVANIHMSTSYRNWSKEYYILDKNAEEKVNQLNTLLQNAESDAQKYMSGQYYLYISTDPKSMPTVAPVSETARNYINKQWLTVPLYEPDVNDSDYHTKLQYFKNDTFQRLYFYYASRRLQDEGYIPMGNPSVTYCKDTTASSLNYQEKLFNLNALDDGTSREVFLDGNIVVGINSADAINAIGAIEPNFVNGKSVAVKVDVRFPKYEDQPQTKQIPIQGNPVWANAITAAGNIGFEGAGPITINGDIFSADKNETLPIKDNVVTDNGIYIKGAAVDINGNVYTKGNLHINGSNSTITVDDYPENMDVTMKKNIFSKNEIPNDLPNTLYFDLAVAEKIPGIAITDYIQDYIPEGQTYMPLIYQDVNGGNVYSNSLSVDGTYTYPSTNPVSDATISVAGNVTTYNDILMDGLNSTITVGKNYIGINSTPDSTGNPNASSSVINNTPLTATKSIESKIILKGNFIVPGTAFAKYDGVKTAEDALFRWDDDIYYQTGESISASNSDIFIAYMAAVLNPHDGYNYYYNQYSDDNYTSEHPPATDLITQSDIHSYYFMQRKLKIPHVPDDSDISEWKTQQLISFLTGKPVVTNVIGSSVDGYSLGAALLQKTIASPATIYDFESDDTDYQNYSSFKVGLAKIFKANTQQLGTDIPLGAAASSFDGVFVDTSLLTGEGVHSSPTSIPDSFVYSQEASTNLDLTLGDKSGIIYCVGDLNIIGNGKFNGAIICEGNVKLSGSPTITYDEGVIKKILMSSASIRNFFAKVNSEKVKMGVVAFHAAPSYDGAVRTNAVRYKIIEWKEEQQ